MQTRFTSVYSHKEYSTSSTQRASPPARPNSVHNRHIWHADTTMSLAVRPIGKKLPARPNRVSNLASYTTSMDASTRADNYDNAHHIGT